MSSTPSPSSSTPEDDPRKLLSEEAKARIKDSGRESRLSFKKFAEHQLRKELKEIALAKCRDQVQAFGRCAQENGLMVVWTCRPFFKEVNACLAIHNSEEEWQKYKKIHQAEIDKWEKKQVR